MTGWLVKTVRIVLATVLCLVVACGLWFIVARTVFHQEQPSVFGYLPLAVVSGSMEPAVSVGDLMVVHQEEAYRVGDVVAFWDGGSLTTHRIVAQTPAGFITKGDANNAQDSQPVVQEQIAGRMVLAFPAVGSVLLFLRTPLGLLVLVTMGVVAVVLPECAGRTRRKKERCVE